ncbi:MAG: hypothetical protein AAF581_19090 [Planctomycetota bacterium]
MHARSLRSATLLVLLALGPLSAQADYTVSLNDVSGAPGGTVTTSLHVEVAAGALPCAGFALSIWSPDDQLTPFSSAVSPTLMAFNGGAGPDHLHIHTYFGQGGVGFNMAIVFGTPALDWLPAGDHHCVDMVWQVADGAPSYTSIVFCDCIGSTPLASEIVSSDGSSSVPAFVPSNVTINPSPVFFRGDANSDGTFNIADPVFTLFYLFSFGPGDCLAAMDANGDDVINVADPLYSLFYINSLGPVPPPPFLQCSEHLTGLSCHTTGICP